MLKQLFKKVQKIPISLEIVHFLFSLFNSMMINLHVFRKLIKFSFIFCVQNKKRFLAKKSLFLKVNLLKPVHVKKNCQF